MNVVRHDHVATHGPAVAISRRNPFFDQDVCYFASRENWTTILRARRDEVDRGIDPDLLQPPQMFVHRGLL